MNNASRRAVRRRPTDRQELRPDSLRTADGVDIPVWDADAADPIDYLASVIDLLPGSRSRQAVTRE